MISGRSFAQNEGMQRLPNGVQYKIYTSNSGTKIKQNDLITFNFIQKTDKDSVLASSYPEGRPMRLVVQPSANIMDLMYFFPMLGEKDSALVKVPTDSVFKDPAMQRPPFLPKGSDLFFVLKIEKVQSMEQVMAEQKRIMDSLNTAELTALERYIADNKLNTVKTTSGLRYVVTAPSAKRKPAAGDSVQVNYTGRTLAGKVFDSSIEANAKAAGLEQPGRNYEPISFVVGEGRVIKGWDEGLLLLGEGAKATFIIPSDLAYGERGAGSDIAPFSSLVFDVELVKVTPAKKELPAVPAKAGVKPPVKKTAPATTKAKPKIPVKKTTTGAAKTKAAVKK